MASEKRHGDPETDTQAGIRAAKRLRDNESRTDRTEASERLLANKHDTEPITDVVGDATPQQIDTDLLCYYLKVPECGAAVTRQYSSASAGDRTVKAYGKIAGRNWHFYIKSMEIVIGRSVGAPTEDVDIDLAPSRVVSRRHAVVRYQQAARKWEITTVSRNGLRVDGVLHKLDSTTTLRSGSIVDVGGVEMMFVWPDAEPEVSPGLLQRMRQNFNIDFVKRDPQTSAQMAATAPGTQGNDSSGENTRDSNSGPSRSRPFKGELASYYPHGVTMVSRPQVSAAGAEEQYNYDLSADDCKDIKPPFSYATMISQAILSTPEHMLSLADIYAWIAGHYAYYRRSKPGWQNSIRHNLSLNKAFEKVARRENEPGKGSKWHIVDAYKEELIRKATTGKLFRGAYIPRRPYEDSPPPANPINPRQLRAEAGRLNTSNIAESRSHKDGNQSANYQQPDHPGHPNQRPQHAQHVPQQQQQQRGGANSSSGPQNAQVSPMPYGPHGPVPMNNGQPGYPMPVPMDVQSGYPVGYQFMGGPPPFGMPYYTPPPGGQGYPVMYPPPPHQPGQPGNQSSGPPSGQPSQPSPSGQSSPIKEDQPGNSSPQEGKAESEPKDIMKQGSHTQTKPAKEMMTPARVHPSSRTGDAPALEGDVKLSQPGPVAPESSPWKYLDLGSTPNTAEGPKPDTEAGPASSPPHPGPELRAVGSNEKPREQSVI